MGFVINIYRTNTLPKLDIYNKTGVTYIMVLMVQPIKNHCDYFFHTVDQPTSRAIYRHAQ